MTRKTLIGLGIIFLVAIAGIIAFGLNPKPDAVPRSYKIGIISNVTGVTEGLASPFLVDPIVEFFDNRGYVQGENIDYLLSIPGTDKTLEQAAQELIDADSDIVFALGTRELQVVRMHDSNIPTILLVPEAEYKGEVRQQVEEADSNLTAVIQTSGHEKRFDILMQVMPDVDHIFIIDSADRGDLIEALERIAPSYNVTVETTIMQDRSQAQLAVDSISLDSDVVFINADITALAAPLIAHFQQTGIPIISPSLLKAGGILLGYGTDFNDSLEIMVRLADQILSGTDADDLPAEFVEPSLLVQLGVADAIGVEIPDSVVQQARIVDDTPVVMPAQLASEGFCNATLSSPLGEDKVCISLSCADVRDDGVATYIDKTQTDTCATEELLGICKTDTRSIYFYSGQAAIFESYCVSGGGSWLTSAE